jgi:polysaccharide biosynthesis protein PslH
VKQSVVFEATFVLWDLRFAHIIGFICIVPAKVDGWSLYCDTWSMCLKRLVLQRHLWASGNDTRMRRRSLRVLYLTSSWPHGPAFGGQLRALHVGRALARFSDVTILNVGSDAGNIDAMRQTKREFSVLPPVIPTATPNGSLMGKVRWALDTRFLNVHGIVATAGDRERVASYLSDFDIVWILNSRTPNILLRWEWPHAHLDLDDVPSTYERAAGRHGFTAGQRWKARVRQLLLCRRERLLPRRFTTLSVCSHADRAYLGADERIHVIPNGFDRPKTEPARNLSQDLPRIGFIGLYSYAPNLHGVRWFLNKCWPTIRRMIPGVRFRMIGKETDGHLKPIEPGVDAMGWVADPASEIATWSAMIIPIHLGGGTRIKIAEAFSRKCPVVSTTFGAYGYEVSNGNQLLLVDEAEEFSRGCVELLRDPARASSLAERAWVDFLEKWTWDVIAPKVEAAADDCLRRSSSREVS